MTNKSVVIKIKAIIEACEEAKQRIVPTYYETAEAVAYRHIVELVKGVEE